MTTNNLGCPTLRTVASRPALARIVVATGVDAVGTGLFLTSSAL